MNNYIILFYYLVWSLGMVLYEMLTLKLPYEEIVLLDVKEHVLAKHTPVIPSNMINNVPLLSLFTLCTKFDPTERPTADEVLIYIKQNM